MSINLVKGQKISIGKTNIRVCLGWDASHNGEEMDLDVSAFLLDSRNGLAKHDENNFVFYNNLESPCGGVKHSGDNRTGEGDGDDEIIFVDTNKMSPDITDIIFVVSIYEVGTKKLNFGQVKNSYIRIVDNENDEEILRFDLEEEFSVERSLEIGRLYNKSGEWKFDALGVSYHTDLDFLVNKYNI